MPAPGATLYLWYVEGARYTQPQPAVPGKRPGSFYLPRAGRVAILGVDLFTTQSEARRVATANAKAEAPA